MQVIFHKSFDKQYIKLSPKIHSRFEERLKIFLTSPFAPLLNNHSVDEIFPECRSINITGDYRAIFKMRDSIPVFIKIGTHHELYGK